MYTIKINVVGKSGEIQEYEYINRETKRSAVIAANKWVRGFLDEIKIEKRKISDTFQVWDVE